MEIMYDGRHIDRKRDRKGKKGCREKKRRERKEWVG